jgi:hypothetical protein
MKKLLIALGLILAVSLLALTEPAIAQQQHLTAADWMAADPTSRGIYVMGYIDGIEEMLIAHGIEVRAPTGTYVSPQLLSEAMYNKLLREPELRQGAAQTILMQVAGSVLMVSDRNGQAIPKSERLMTTSECAELIVKSMPGGNTD